MSSTDKARSNLQQVLAGLVGILLIPIVLAVVFVVFVLLILGVVIDMISFAIYGSMGAVSYLLDVARVWVLNIEYVVTRRGQWRWLP